MRPVSSAASRRALELPRAHLGDLAAIREFLRSAGTELGVDTSTISDLVIAVNEAAANIIRHGYRGSTGPIEVVLERQATRIVVHVRDRAPTFDPTSVPAPDLNLPLERRRAGGLGVHLTRSCVDAMTHRPLTGEGNELTLVKALAYHEGGIAR